jgi:hypothetical protein
MTQEARAELLRRAELGAQRAWNDTLEANYSAVFAAFPRTRPAQSVADAWRAIGDAPCGCPECDNGVTPGHFACEVSPAWALELEAAGKAVRYFNDTSWVWEAL